MSQIAYFTNRCFSTKHTEVHNALITFLSVTYQVQSVVPSTCFHAAQHCIFFFFIGPRTHYMSKLPKCAQTTVAGAAMYTLYLKG